MRTKISLTALIALILLLSGCNTPSDPLKEKPTITVSGSGTATTVPDIVDIQLGVEAINSDPVEAISQNTAKMNAMMAVLDDLGIQSGDIQTVFYNMWVEEVYDQEGQSTGEKRYHVTNQVNVRLRQLDKIGTLIEMATAAGATNIAGITFGIEDTTELGKMALDNATTDAYEKAERIASNMGMTLGEVVTLVEGGVYSPGIPFVGDKGGLGGGSPVPISQGQFSMTAQLQVVFNLIQE